MISRQPSGYDARLRWDGVTGRGRLPHLLAQGVGPRLGARAVRRNVTEFVLPNMNIDDHVFGVAAVGPGGHESTISAYVMAPRLSESSEGIAVSDQRDNGRDRSRRLPVRSPSFSR